MNSIKFYNNEENVVVVESNDFEESIFKSQYLKALYTLDNILKNDNCKGNNIVAFCGDRGEGKTSCMLTVKNILKGYNNSNVVSFLKNNKLENLLLELKNLDVTDEIDPLFFDENHNLLDLVLSSIYNKTNIFKDDRGAQDENNNCFVKEIFRDLDKIKGYMYSLTKKREKLYDPLEELELLSGGIQLKEHVDRLINDYLVLVKKNRIVLFIDDIDLNMENAYQMMEEMRKYLNNNKLIIFLSCKIDQLEIIVNQNMKKPLGVIDVEKYQLGRKYLTKLISLNSRIYMPKVIDISDKELFLYDKRDGKEIAKFNSIKEAVVELIFNKTRYLFYNSKNSVSPIVPNNLRVLRQLLAILLNMEDHKDKGNNNFHDNILNENKKIFKTFFYNVWIQCLSAEDQIFVNKLVNYLDVTSVNKMVVHNLNKKLKNYGKEEYEDIIKPFQDIVNNANVVYNVSFGDVMKIIYFLERFAVDEELRLFIFFIKSYYSICLYDFYLKIKDDKVAQGDNSIGEIYKTDEWFKQTNVMQRFVNGSYFTYDPNDILSSKENDSIDYKILDGNKLKECFKFLVENKQKMEELNPNVNMDDNNPDLFQENKKNDIQFIKEYKYKFHLAEFFALTIVSNLESKKVKENIKKDRISTIPHHLKKFNSSIGYYVFDILAPFYNILNVKYTYSKFNFIKDWDFYKAALNFKWSLLNMMIDECKKNGKVLLSDSVIRNAELWTAIREQMQIYRDSSHAGGKDAERIIKLYKNINSIGMSTYEKNEKGEYFVVKYHFLDAISLFLNEVKDIENNDDDVKMPKLKYFDKQPNNEDK